jgi:hypothetical protein
MNTHPKLITVDDETMLSAILDEAASNPVRLERDGVVFRLVREDADPWTGYDPEHVRAGLRSFAGTITPEEAERMKALIYRAREEGTRSIKSS